MSTCKYIAAGFIDDAEKLFNDFAQCGDNDFKTFCNVWKKYMFVHVFMGRPSYKEMREFISEIYQLTLNYMTSSALNSQIAAIYLLYSLYINQNVISPVKIRISVLQYHALNDVHSYAVKQKVHTLHYIIDYLKKKCLELIANSTLFGPCCSLYKDNPTKSKADELSVLSYLRQDMTIFRDSEIISNLKKARNHYLNQKNSIMYDSGAEKESDLQVIDEYSQTIQELTQVLGKSRDYSNPAEKDSSSLTGKNNSEPTIEMDDIGYRRFKLKQAAFENGCHKAVVQEQENNATDDIAKICLIKKRNYNRRIPVHERRVGRPKKHVEKDAISDSEDSDFQQSYQFMQNQVTKSTRGPIGRRKTSYLKNYEGPIFLTSNQKPIDSYSDTSEEAYCDDIVF